MTMKKLYLTLVVLLMSSALVYSQKPNAERKLDPVKGYYKSLQSFSTNPKSSNEEIDKQKFPYDAATAERRLSLKPYYLENVKLEDFKIPDPPANSSEQTRAEINYLVALQAQRTKLDVESSLYLANIYYNLRVKPTDSTYSRFRNNLFHIGHSIGTWF